MLEKINQTADYIRSKVTDLPKTAIILGTGLEHLSTTSRTSNTSPTLKSPTSPYRPSKAIQAI